MDLEENIVEEIEFLFVDVLMETSEGTIIYDGMLVDYELSKTGGIEFIKLTDVRRRYLLNEDESTNLEKNQRFTPTELKKLNKKHQKSYYEIPGQIFIIPYDKVLNLNLTYYALDFNANKMKFSIKEVK